MSTSDARVGASIVSAKALLLYRVTDYRIRLTSADQETLLGRWRRPMAKSLRTRVKYHIESNVRSGVKEARIRKLWVGFMVLLEHRDDPAGRIAAQQCYSDEAFGESRKPQEAHHPVETLAEQPGRFRANWPAHETLKDEHNEIRFLAAQALTRIGPAANAAKGAMPLLSEDLKDEHGDVLE
jgi:hypothetical protein